MFRKHAPLLFIALSFICIKLSSDATTASVIKEAQVLEFAGLKIQSLKRNPTQVDLEKPPVVVFAQAKKSKALKSCTPIKDFKSFKKEFLNQNKEPLKKVLGAWYIDEPDELKFDYNFLLNLSDTALYSSGLYATKKSFEVKDKLSPMSYMPVNIFYKAYYKERTNSDAIFYIYEHYRKSKVDAASFNYLKTILKESSTHQALNQKVHSEVYKLVKDPDSLMGAFQTLKGFSGLSSGAYKTTLLELEKEPRLELAKLLVKKGSEKTAVNKNLEWNTAAYQAAYSVLKEEDMARAYLPLDELLKDKSDSNRSFIDKLSRVKTDCDLEEVWDVASAVIREIQ